MKCLCADDPISSSRRTLETESVREAIRWGDEEQRCTICRALYIPTPSEVDEFPTEAVILITQWIKEIDEQRNGRKSLQ